MIRLKMAEDGLERARKGYKGRITEPLIAFIEPLFRPLSASY